MAQTNNYETTVELPSRGLLYDNIPKDITLRMITTADEKFLYGSTSGNVFSKVLKSCIVTPKDLDVGDLLPCDELFLIYKLRAHTYGPEYRVTGICPHCGNKQVYTVNLDELPVLSLNEGFTEPLEFTLPDCEKRLSIKYLRNRDNEAVRRQAKKIAKATGTNPKELEYVIRMARYIKKIDNDEIDEGQAQAFVEKLTGRDSAYFWWKINESFQCGLDNVVEVSCGSCNEEFDLPCAINSEFFRPKFG